MITKQIALKLNEDLRIQVAKEFGVGIGYVRLSYMVYDQNLAVDPTESDKVNVHVTNSHIVQFFSDDGCSSFCQKGLVNEVVL